MNKPTKKQLYNMLAEYKNIIDVYEKILSEFKIKKVEERVEQSYLKFGHTILQRMYRQGKDIKYVAIHVDDEYLDLYGVDKNGK